MDAMITARVPLEHKQLAAEAFGKLGLGASQVIQMMWAFAAAHAKDPDAVRRLVSEMEPADEAELEERRRKLAAAAKGRQAVEEGLKHMGLELSGAAWAKSDKELMEEALVERMTERGLW